MRAAGPLVGFMLNVADGRLAVGNADRCDGLDRAVPARAAGEPGSTVVTTNWPLSAVPLNPKSYGPKTKQ